jgi:hypothetical protein
MLADANQIAKSNSICVITNAVLTLKPAESKLQAKPNLNTSRSSWPWTSTRPKLRRNLALAPLPDRCAGDSDSHESLCVQGSGIPLA